MRIAAIAFLQVALICALAGGAWADPPCDGDETRTGGLIGLYSDNPGFTDCFLTETLYVSNFIYVVHTPSYLNEAGGVRFRVVHNWHAPIVQGVSYFGNSAAGDIYNGVTVTYDGCTQLPHAIAEMGFIPTESTPACTAYFFVVHDLAAASGEIEVTDCDGQLHYARGGLIKVNGNDNDCPCTGCETWPNWVETEAATWGSIKAMYR